MLDEIILDLIRALGEVDQDVALIFVSAEFFADR